MKKIMAIGIIGMFLATSFIISNVSGEEKPDQIQLSYSFEAPAIKNVEINGETYARITMTDAISSGDEPGVPSLPEKGVKILIPQGRRVNGIIVSTAEKIHLGSGLKVEPVEEPIPSAIDIDSTLVQNKRIYQSKDMYPGKLYTTVGSYVFRGYEILVLNLHPVQYIPATGELFYYPSLSVSVNTVEDNELSSLFRGSNEDELKVMGMVTNPSYVVSYAKNLYSVPSTEFDLLILTTDDLKNGFVPLKDYHNNHGVATVIKTLSDVGSNDPEEIRSYIRDAYNNWGI
jgi:hypothetical protein